MHKTAILKVPHMHSLHHTTRGKETLSAHEILGVQHFQWFTWLATLSSAYLPFSDSVNAIIGWSSLTLDKDKINTHIAHTLQRDRLEKSTYMYIHSKPLNTRRKPNIQLAPFQATQRKADKGRLQHLTMEKADQSFLTVHTQGD